MEMRNHKTEKLLLKKRKVNVTFPVETLTPQEGLTEEESKKYLKILKLYNMP